jgi:hypothetical protein
VSEGKRFSAGGIAARMAAVKVNESKTASKFFIRFLPALDAPVWMN